MCAGSSAVALNIENQPTSHIAGHDEIKKTGIQSPEEAARHHSQIAHTTDLHLGLFRAVNAHRSKEYRSGHFYKRPTRCIRPRLLEEFTLKSVEQKKPRGVKD